jgi:hypothetical protein
VKCGFAGANFPTAVFPSLVGRPILRSEEKIEGVEIKVHHYQLISLLSSIFIFSKLRIFSPKCAIFLFFIILSFIFVFMFSFLDNKNNLLS